MEILDMTFAGVPVKHLLCITAAAWVVGYLGEAWQQWRDSGGVPTSEADAAD